ncbi:hypothetical protein MMC21_006688 [Puttea exsequens]|nr:hypothetical protein [Puttea exsequens]
MLRPKPAFSYSTARDLATQRHAGAKSMSPIHLGPPQYTRIPNLKICRIAVSPDHKISHIATAALLDTSNVLHEQKRQRYNGVIHATYDREQEGLWIKFTVASRVAAKKVVKSWAKRRIMVAIVQELKRKGFDRAGRQLKGQDDGTKPMGNIAGKASKPKTLVGTLSIDIQKPCVMAAHQDVQQQTRLVVKEVLRVCGDSRNGTDAKSRPWRLHIPKDTSASLHPDDSRNKWTMRWHKST